MSAAQLIRLARPLGFSASNVKSHLTRMVAEGALERRGPVRLANYRPAPKQKVIIDGIMARLTETPSPAWDGRWFSLVLRLPKSRGERESLRAILWFDGFRPLSQDVFVRPAWPLPWAGERALQYAAQAPGFCVLGELVFAPKNPACLYDLDGLDAEARSLAAWIRHRTRRGRSPQAAFVDRIRVGGRIAQLIGHDPRLPRALWGKRRGIVDAIHAFRHFEDRIAPQAQLFLDVACT